MTRSGVGSPATERLWAKVIKGSPNGCWVWQGANVGRPGHGRIIHNGRLESTHRVSWMLANGPIPDGLWVLHICDNPPCVNPRHLYLGTALDNARDAVVRKRLRHPARSITRCKWGHDYTPENTYRAPKTGRRQCRTCRLDKLTRYKDAHRIAA